MDNTLKFNIIIVGIFIGVFWNLEPIRTILYLLLAPRYGLLCTHIKAFGFQFQNENGKWTCKKDKFTPIIQHMITIDITKPISEDIENKTKHFAWITYLIRSFFVLVVVFLCSDELIALISGEDASVVKLLLGSFALGIIIKHAMDAYIIIYSNYIVKKSLGGYIDSMLNKIRQGVSFAELNLKPVAQLPYNNPSKVEKMLYYRLYIPYLIFLDDIEGLKEPIREMTDYYAVRDFILQEVLSYYWLIFYYSHYDFNPSKADMYYERVSRTLLNDKDANAKRVLAYYYYDVKKDVEKAYQYVREGLAVIDNFSIPGSERELERKLLMDLDAIIFKRMTQW